MAKGDLLKITVHNSYGDTFEKTLEDPNCEELVAYFTTIAQQLGYSISNVHDAFAASIGSYERVRKIKSNNSLKH